MTKLNVREFVLITASLLLTGMGFYFADTTPLDGVQSKVTITPATQVEASLGVQWTQQVQGQPHFRLP